MENKKGYLTKTILCLMIIAVLTGCIAVCSMKATASAVATNPTSDADPLGLAIKITLKLGSTGTEVWADAHNDFTLGKSTVIVYVFLYSSHTFEESCSNMTLESQKLIGDLDINKSVRTSAPINGVQRYWRGKVMYKLDNKDWVTKETITVLVDVNGNLV